MKLFLGSSLRKFYTSKEKDIIIGINSKVEDDKHIILLEYDNFDLKEVKKKVEKVMKKYKNLSDFHIMKSSKGHYHVISFTCVNFKKYLEIMKYADMSKRYIFFTKKYNQSTLRISKKVYKKSSNIELKEIIVSDNPKREDLKNQYFNLINLERSICH